MFCKANRYTIFKDILDANPAPLLRYLHTAYSSIRLYMSDGLNKKVAINNYVFSKLKPGFPKDLSFVWKHAFSKENRSTIMESFSVHTFNVRL